MIEKILNAKEYFKAIPESILEKRSIWKLSLELRFLQSKSSETTAYETGYYKNESVNSITNEIKASVMENLMSY